MIAEIGQITLVIALVLALLQGLLPLWGAHRLDGRLMAFGDHAAIAQAVFLTIGFGLLLYVFVVSDFSVALVETNSHTSKPLIYKLSGAWGNHEGSMLMWVAIISWFGAAMALFGQALPTPLRARAIAVQGLIGVGFLSFMIFTSNPFERLLPIPEDGTGLNPLLQDPGLAFHPPFLYLGYVGFSVAFSFAVAALIEGRVDALWARFVRPWVLAAWSFLTLGIALGSLWAYYELGWGGWWFWDPVENVSLMPWLAGTALLHSTLVVEKRNTFVNWTLLLAITTFSLSLIGTFVVRSGLLTSVHAFAVDPERGQYILGLIVLSTGGALLLYALRSEKISSTTGFDALSKEGGLVFNNLLLCIATATVFIGTFYPVVIDGLAEVGALPEGSQISVGPPYFNMLFGPVMIVLIMIMAVGPLIKWRQDSLARLKRPLIIIGGVAALTAIAALVFGKAVWGVIGFTIAAALFASALISLSERLFIGRAPIGRSLSLIGTLPASSWGFLMGHIGLAVTVVGITGISVWGQEGQANIERGETAQIIGHDVHLRDVQEFRAENYIAQIALLEVSKDGRHVTSLRAERRIYPVEDELTTEAALDIHLFQTYYGAFTVADGNALVIRFYSHPLVSWIWGGCLIMALGGFVSMTDRRFRAAKPASVSANPQPAE